MPSNMKRQKRFSESCLSHEMCLNLFHSLIRSVHLDYSFDLPEFYFPHQEMEITTYNLPIHRVFMIEWNETMHMQECCKMITWWCRWWPLASSASSSSSYHHLRHWFNIVQGVYWRWRSRSRSWCLFSHFSIFFPSKFRDYSVTVKLSLNNFRTPVRQRQYSQWINYLAK